jgi:DNA-directed RNA polymerase subunit RPC12/RpoP
MSIRVLCSFCKREFDAPDFSAGQEEMCPNCAMRMTVPLPKKSPPPRRAAPAAPPARPGPSRPAPPEEAPEAAAPAEEAAPEGETPGDRKPSRRVSRTCPACGGKIPPGKSRCENCGQFYAVVKTRQAAQEERQEFFAPEKKALSWGVAGGGLMILIAVVWFFVGLAAGYIFFYPPILFLIGLVGLLRGLFTGNIAGE